MQEMPAPPIHVLRSIVSTHNDKGMNYIDSDEGQVPKEPRNCTNRRPRIQKRKRKEKTAIELVSIDIGREQLHTKYDADMDHMFSHDIDSTMLGLVTNVVVLSRFSPLPADHDLYRIRFEEKSVKDGIYHTLDHGLVRAHPVIAGFDADRIRVTAVRTAECRSPHVPLIADSESEARARAQSNAEKWFLARAYLWTKKLERGLRRRHDEAPVSWIQLSAGVLGLLSRLQEWARSRSEFRLAIIAEVTEIEYIPDGQSGTIGFWLFMHAELCTHEVSEKLGAVFGVIEHDQKRKTGKAIRGRNRLGEKANEAWSESDQDVSESVLSEENGKWT
ncbi:hypothetical protein LTR17_019123 [Elasticomyces elasticus]|nr:hypothetical protein LTR17_019123 [Elasticomyces elasticus]